MRVPFDVTRRRILELGIRDDLHSLISRCPGIHFREIQRRVQVATGQLSHHLRLLVKAGLLRTESDGKYLRYYAEVDMNLEEKRVLELAHRRSVRRILLCLLEYDACNNQQLTEELNLAPSTVSWHIKRLIEENLVSKRTAGRESFYSLNDAEFVRQVLVKYRASLMDRLVDGFVEMWEP